MRLRAVRVTGSKETRGPRKTRVRSSLAIILVLTSIMMIPSSLNFKTAQATSSLPSQPRISAEPNNSSDSNRRIEVWSPALHSSNITSLALTPGSTFTVEVNVTGAPPIGGFDISLNYNLTVPNVLQVVKPSNPDDPLTGGLFDPNNVPAGCPSLLPLKEEIDSPPGLIRYATGWVGACTSNGTGVLLSLTFRVTGIGVTTIDVQQAPRFGQLACLVAGPVTSGPSSVACFSLEVFNGYFRNKPGIPPVPSFVYTPSRPLTGSPVFFNATKSFDPDNPLAPNGGVESEAIVFDRNDNKQYDAGDTVLIGPTPPIGGYLGEPHPNPLCRLPNCIPDRPDQHLTFVDANSNGAWDQGEAVVYDSDLNRLFQTGNSSLDFVITGSAPPEGSGLTFNSTLTYYDLHPNNIWDNGYVWLFGDNLNSFTGNVTAHLFLVNTVTPAPGYFAVRLTVFDSDDGLANRASTIVHILSTVPPVASFTFSPADITVGTQVRFDGSSSFDPDGSVVKWAWSFGDGFFSPGDGSPLAFHTYSSRGAYTVTLTVTDNVGGVGSISQSLNVRQVSHDVGIVYLQAPLVAISSQTVNIIAGLINYGNSSETVGLTAYNGNHTAGSLTAIKVGTSPYSQTFTIPWDTFGVPAGNYTITARLFSSTDEVPSNNNFTDGTIRILPAPTLTVTPDTGPIGTTVRLQGSGFPDYYYSSQFQIEVTFDDQLVGLAQTKEGQFSFTFNIPLAQPGTHTIKALDTSTAKATASFLLKQNAPIPRIDVEAKGGTIYFPGDTAIIFVQTKINGQPVSVSNLQVTLMRPNGQITNLTAFLVAPGEWKATFAVPTTGSIGTYGVTVKAQQSGSIDGSSIVSFEVKPTWLQAHGPTVLGATAALGALGVLTFAWRKKYWTRRKGEPPF